VSQVQQSKQKLHIIQVLRALAVLCVVVSHIAHELAYMLAGRISNFNSKLFPGDFGVDLFFVISGFIMAYTCWESFGTNKAASRFMMRRFIRVVPLYWVATTLIIAVVLVFPERVNTATSDWQQWLSSYFFIPYARDSDALIRPVLGLGWSLQYEMFFYLLFAAGLMFARRIGLLVIVGSLIAIWGIANLFGGDQSDAPTLLRFLSHSIALEFAIGVLLGYLYMKNFRLSKSVGLFALVVGVFLLMIVPNFNEAIDQNRLVHYGVPAALITAAAILTRGYDERSVPRSALEIGETSYAIYLTHPFVIGATSVLFWKTNLVADLDPLNLLFTYSAIVIILTIAIGYVVHYWFDLPFTNHIRRAVSVRNDNDGVALETRFMRVRSR